MRSISSLDRLQEGSKMMIWLLSLKLKEWVGLEDITHGILSEC